MTQTGTELNIPEDVPALVHMPWSVAIDYSDSANPVRFVKKYFI